MGTQKVRSILFAALILSMTLSACGVMATPMPTSTPQPTATATLVPTNTPTPTATPRPTITPNLAATQQVEALNAEVQSYYDEGYLSTTEGKFRHYDDFSYTWAQLGWYDRLPLKLQASDFFLSAHFKWESAYRSANISGCGFVFAAQDNGDHYAVFLDWTKVLLYLNHHIDYRSTTVGPVHESGKVFFTNPADAPAEADFTLIVNGLNAYVLVDKRLAGQYSLGKSMDLNGHISLTVLSGTNKDFGTRCEMTNIHAWIPNP